MSTSETTTQPHLEPADRPGFDQTRSEQFGGKLLEVLNHQALSLMLSIGHRTGLFDTLAEMEPATSAAIAEQAGLQERYVREWLGAMAVSRIVDYRPCDRTYALPPEHAAFLTRKAAPNNLAVFCQYTAVLGSVEDQVVESFRNGGGVPYCAYCRFQSVMAEDSGQTVLPALEEFILPLVPGLQARLETGIRVLDVGCGKGLAMHHLAQRYPRSRFTGCDLSSEAIAAARSKAGRDGLTNLQYEVRDAAAIDEVEAYDLICTFDAVHDQAQPEVVLRNIARALKPDGVYLMQDIAGSSRVEENFNHPLGTLLYTVSTMHCMTVSLANGGAGLGAMWGEDTAERMLREAGFTDVAIHHLEHDPQNAYFVNRP